MSIAIRPDPAADPAALRETTACKLLAALDLAIVACDPTSPGYSADEAPRLIAALRPIRDQAREVLEP